MKEFLGEAMSFFIAIDCERGNLRVRVTFNLFKLKFL